MMSLVPGLGTGRWHKDGRWEKGASLVEDDSVYIGVGSGTL